MGGQVALETVHQLTGICPPATLGRSRIYDLRTMADDIEPAFPDLRDDERFSKAASGLRAALDAARNSPPLNCAGVGAVMKDVGAACKACHQDFRN